MKYLFLLLLLVGCGSKNEASLTSTVNGPLNLIADQGFTSFDMVQWVNDLKGEKYPQIRVIFGHTDYFASTSEADLRANCIKIAEFLIKASDNVIVYVDTDEYSIQEPMREVFGAYNITVMNLYGVAL